MGQFIVLGLLIVLILGYIMFAISQNIKDNIKSLKQRIFELEDEVKKLKK